MQDLVIVKKQNKEIVRKKSTDSTKKQTSDHSCQAVSLILRCLPLIGPEITSRLECCLRLLHRSHSAALAPPPCCHLMKGFTVIFLRFEQTTNYKTEFQR